ncbi:endopeptidase catalytic subunit Ecym_2304 [Eremothecium cymbalariae DBVPG|uniref:Mitochondrial inner membrane protease subunit 2 n=1 Tax=Eremothecium cymbalariae (strain CBS 270.75 / DBVPG 7215 / KCTC 17166 / NRRL Y-17582) TaxID=931890 RepID=G8JQ44_ERECY|nr:Hypothetical protein Ecym_2304 [Eremothecium cymbalariae DBVPG\
MFQSKVLNYSLATISWLPVYLTVTHHVMFVSKIEGPSMRPTLNPRDNMQSDWVFVWKLRKTDIRALNYGDVIIFKSPNNPKKVYCKRIQGKQYDVVKTKFPYPREFCQIPRSHLWVEGDNGSNSVDSNNFGPISTGLVIGTITNVIWPPSRWGAELKRDLGRPGVVVG